jgi:nucleotidyltransferase substrate binding protein (TIGR01987 family)
MKLEKLTKDLEKILLKLELEEKYGIICKSPKGFIREAFTQGLIEYDDYWLKIVDLRNNTAYIYSEYMADEVYEELPKVLVYLKKLYNKMRE